jgi:tetratricopeptide (TPR) repeat protein
MVRFRAMNRMGGGLAWLMVMAWIFSCDSYRVGRLVQSGRQALLKKDFEAALSYFEKAAKKDPQYIFEAAHFKEGIWTYVGRTQYATGRYAQARQSPRSGAPYS